MAAAWQAPCLLQVWASRAMVTRVVAHTQHRVRAAIGLVPPELLVARATARLLLRRDDDDTGDEDDYDDDDCGDEDEGSWEQRVRLQQDVDIMDYAMLQVKVSICCLSKLHNN